MAYKPNPSHSDDPGFAPAPGSNDAANYGYGRQGVDGSQEAYAPAPGSNDAANYGYGRQGVEELVHPVEPTGRAPAEEPNAGNALPIADTTGQQQSPEAATGIRQRLHEDWMVDAANVDVAVVGHEAILSGTVATKAQRQRAEDLARLTSGIASVRNHIRVDGLGTNAQ